MIDYRHFLDISSIRDISNKEHREKIKKRRKEEKKLHDKFITDLPGIELIPMNSNSKIEQFKGFEKKDKIIPVYKWDELSDIHDLKLYVRNLVPSYYENLAIRVIDSGNFITHKEEIKKLPISYVILDMNTNFDIESIEKIINKIEIDFDNIIYLGAQFNAEDISIGQDDANTNLIAGNRPLKVFESISKNIGYGDYCGFDRKTITELPNGGRATSRVVLNSLDDTKKILVRRGFDSKDIVRDPVTKRITKFGNTNSMKKLLCDIQKGLLDNEGSSVFMDKEICDADYSLKDFCPDPTSPAVIKTLCFRHNVFAIKYVYLS